MPSSSGAAGAVCGTPDRPPIHVICVTHPSVPSKGHAVFRTSAREAVPYADGPSVHARHLAPLPPATRRGRGKAASEGPWNRSPEGLWHVPEASSGRVLPNPLRSVAGCATVVTAPRTAAAVPSRMESCHAVPSLHGPLTRPVAGARSARRAEAAGAPARRRGAHRATGRARRRTGSADPPGARTARPAPAPARRPGRAPGASGGRRSVTGDRRFRHVLRDGRRPSGRRRPRRRGVPHRALRRRRPQGAHQGQAGARSRRRRRLGTGGAAGRRRTASRPAGAARDP
ncbi:hypothetical protein STXM2123_4182 [Streptomyces sp. F-3]|nr:hypothetical protein STXM2123_4182 [Streptomyces sp. F-3]